ncbi:MAG TPA: protein kinase [Ktedonobacteraceae bacterium]|nr:protein kinase [Ktedonobacteraceae bacterium]
MMETIPSGTILHRRYRVERVLGSGGFGHVYLAIDLQTNQQYAVKEYLVSGSSGQAQLQHEANVLSHLHHPNLPAFHEAFSERGHYYVVLSYIEGNDLTDIIRVARQRNDVIALPRILNWILSVCDAVMFLHNQHPPVIHRDIKPDNIRITSDGTAILVDLGNAKATGDGARTLFFIRHQGTPGYAPQEQYPGGSGTTVRSDVYALGSTLYFALTAHEPPSVSTRNASIQQNIPDVPSLQDQLLNNPPEESPEANAQRQFRLGVSKPAKPALRHIRHLAQLSTLPPPLLSQLNNIILHAMAMHQKDRYPSVANFSNDLRQIMNAINILPTAQPTVPPRPIDPNSTQPDLPQLYEALQSAKLARTAQPPPDPVTPLVKPDTCPQCGKPWVTKAAFCPHCGYSISGGSTANAPANTAQTPGNAGFSLQNKVVVTAQENNPIGDQQPKQSASRPALREVPPTPAPTMIVPQPVAKPAAAPISTLPPVQHMKTPVPFQAQSIPTTERPLQIPAQRSTGTPVQVNRKARINNQLMLIIALIVIVLIAIIIFLFVRQTAGVQSMIPLPLTFVLVTLGLS